MSLPPQPADFRQHLQIETPEHVRLDYEIAGIGSRALAALIDMLIIAACMTGLVIATAVLLGFGVGRGWAGAVYTGLAFLILTGYFALFEGFRAGQTPGKRRMGLRVVRDTGHPVTPGAALTRNVVRFADMMLPPPYFLGALLVALHPRGKRLGDMVAGTVVVRDRPLESPAAPRDDATPRAAPALAAPLLTDAEYTLLEQFLARSAALDAPVRARLAAGLAARLGEHGIRRAEGDAAFLEQLRAAERERREGRLAGAGPAGAAGQRLAAQKASRWAEFEVLALRASRDGLDSFRAEELPDFAARYRELAADLARLRTYRAPAAVVQRAERLVAAGHNLLYRDERRTWRELFDEIARAWPAAIIESRRYVLAGFLAFIVPAAVGYRVIRERPALAEEILPDVMLRRAEAGALRREQGLRYVEVDAEMRPLTASGIITNNVRVALLCFAGGAALGIGALFLLALNGVQIGSFLGHFANAGLLSYLLEFIVGHGALELFSIWVAGAAGFMLGKALIAPGELARGDALVLAGRRAIRMLGAAAVCLLVAGLIEGFVSTSRMGWAGRAAASAASLLFLGSYLVAGATLRAQSPERPRA